jgi:PKD repeat protein
MRSIRLMAATTVIVALASACGDGGTGIGNPPVANFTPPSCTEDVACQFTDASTPVGGITSWSWNFGDGTALDPNQSPLHTFQEDGTFTVTLTVTNSEGSNSKANTVTVAAGTPTNTPPVASFTAPTGCTVNAPCSFHSTSTDAQGDATITLTRWDFGGGVVLDGVDVSHTFAAAGTFNVILTVTDNLGATGTVTQPVTVSPPVATDCTTDPSNSNWENCLLDITQRATLTITLTSESCELGGNQFHIRQPLAIRQVVFFNGCNEIVGTQYPVRDATGAPAVIEAGTQIQTQFRNTTTPTPGNPAIRLEGTFPTWTMRIDDGGNPGGPGEPDFDDIVLTIQATPR